MPKSPAPKPKSSLFKIAGFKAVKSASGLAFEREIRLVNGTLRMIISEETAREIKDNKTLAVAIAQLAFNGGQHSKQGELDKIKDQLVSEKSISANTKAQLAAIRSLVDDGY